MPSAHSDPRRHARLLATCDGSPKLTTRHFRFVLLVKPHVGRNPEEGSQPVITSRQPNTMTESCVLDIDPVVDVEEGKPLQEFGAMVDVVFEQVKGYPMPVVRSCSVPLVGVDPVELRLIGKEAFESREGSIQLSLQIVLGARCRPDVRVRITVLYVAGQPAVAGVRHVDQDAPRVPQAFLRRPAQGAIGIEVDDVDEVALDGSPVLPRCRAAEIAKWIPAWHRS